MYQKDMEIPMPILGIFQDFNDFIPEDLSDSLPLVRDVQHTMVWYSIDDELIIHNI